VIKLESAQSSPAPQESVLDRKIHLEPVLLQEVPNVPPLCRQLGMKGQKVDIGGCKLYVEEAGKGIPVVLINGGPGGTHHIFHPWFQRANSFAHVVYYDQRGCGRSDWTPGPGYTVEQAVDDLERLRKKLGFDRWVVLGHSYGGLLAQMYALRCLERTLGLVLVGSMPPGLHKDLGNRQSEYISNAERARLQEIRSALDKARLERQLDDRDYVALIVFNCQLNGDWKRQQFYRPSRDDAARIALYEWVNAPDFNAVMSTSAHQYDLQGAFNACAIPTLILEGRWDLTWGPDKASALLANHPGARMVMVEQAGHGIFNEDPELFFKTLREFLGGLSISEPPA
jgi:proline iminopeptidase